MSFAPQSHADIPALIAEYPLAWVISRDFDATLLPLVTELDGEGRLRSLFGHYARRNPQVAAFEHDGSALILFNGPQGYISPTLVSNPTWGPTWNYAAIRIVADVAFVEDETDASLRRLTNHFESDGAWTVERMGDRYDQLAQHIIAFRATVRQCEGMFKLGQDETAATFAEITAGHSNVNLTRHMRAQRRGDDAT